MNEIEFNSKIRSLHELSESVQDAIEDGSIHESLYLETADLMDNLMAAVKKLEEFKPLLVKN